MKTAIVPFQMIVFSERDVTFLAFEFKKPAVVILLMFGEIAFVTKK